MGKTSPAVLRWEPSELKKERTSFFCRRGWWLCAIPTNVGKSGGYGYFAFFEGGGKKKKGEKGEKMKKKHRKSEKKSIKSLALLYNV